jgi:hypothetical protein
MLSLSCRIAPTFGQPLEKEGTSMPIGTRDISLGQFVKQVAGLLQAQSTPLPLKNQQVWHTFFYDLKQSKDPGKPTFFADLVFDWDAPYPKCHELSEFLHALHSTASVSAHNPRYEIMTVDEIIARQWSEAAKNDEPDLRGFVENAAKLASERFVGREAA